MDIRTALASQSYGQARTVAAPELGAKPAKSGFESLAQNFVNTLTEGEQIARNALVGKADPLALVQALASSQSAVETVATVRDKVVEAYQEILRMPV